MSTPDDRDERAVLMAVPLRHLRASTDAAGGAAHVVVLPAGGLGDLADAPSGLPVLVIATDAGDTEVTAATWRATIVGQVPYRQGDPWPEGIPATWADEHPVPEHRAAPVGEDDLDDLDDWDDEDEDEDDLVQTFLAVSGLAPLPRDEWIFANELVGKQARRGRSFRPRVPTIVSLPD